eukprot:1158197-Pelagomonas_calceolata.AAC.6
MKRRSLFGKLFLGKQLPVIVADHPHEKSKQSRNNVTLASQTRGMRGMRESLRQESMYPDPENVSPAADQPESWAVGQPLCNPRDPCILIQDF